MFRQGKNIEAARYLEKARQLDPDSGLLQLEAARILVTRGESEKALLATKKAVEKSPDLIHGWILLGGLYSQKKDVTRAMQAYEKALSLDPDSQETQLLLGMLYWEDGQIERAASLLTVLVNKSPDSALPYYYLGKVYMAQKRYNQAAQNFLRASRLSPRFATARFDLAKAYELQNKNTMAENVYLEILKQNPESARAHDLLGRLYLRTGRTDQALNQFAVVKGLSKSDTDVRIKIGLVHFEQERFAEAAEEFSSILRLEPDNQRARYYLGVSLQEAGDTEEATKVLAEIKPESEFFVDGILHLAEIMDRTDNRDKARALLEKNLSLKPDEPDLMVGLAALLEVDGDLKQAEKLLLRASEQESGNAEIHFRLGVVLDKLSRKEEAMKSLRKAIELDDHHARALNYVGYTLAEKGEDLDEAELLIRRALAVEPYSGFILDSLGWIYYKRGQYDKALVYLERAALSGEEDSVIFEHLGDTAMKLKQYKKAVQAYEHALKQDASQKSKLMPKLKKARNLMKKNIGN
ncbi:tetratricopeptide repeat protein [Dethiosulfatarculus sandiegensis]|uniref:tetratricopeptide repeat protein n=1 Tax=Dethiosulfatarculus sandiegensis TaxID=1429043 RepID=UPI0018D1D3DD|nr:tetratricopeptide repeat protein [Dethiosulfatarculus sandiegensis]